MVITSSLLFQFHKGTIKTVRNVGIPDILRRFQFHKGTIKTDNNAERRGDINISIP